MGRKERNRGRRVEKGLVSKRTKGEKKENGRRRGRKVEKSLAPNRKK